MGSCKPPTCSPECYHMGYRRTNPMRAIQNAPWSKRRRGGTLPAADGNLKPVEDLDDDQAACLASHEVVIKNGKAGDGQTVEIHKIKLWGKMRALELLAKHFGLVTE